jgi:hypothetical protein
MGQTPQSIKSKSNYIISLLYVELEATKIHNAIDYTDQVNVTCFY